MADKILDLQKSVYELCEEDEGIIQVLAEAGFSEITRPGMLATAGRFMTIPKGAAMKRIHPEVIRKIFTEHGYIIKGEFE